MCVAGLNVSTQPCAHRWYRLLRPCHAANNLANCPEKLKLEGWETRLEDCPWCDSEEVDLPETTHRLFGASTSSASTSSASSTLSSPTSPVFGSTRSHRSGSDGSLTSALSRHNSTSSADERGQRHREMNERLHLYLLSDPHEVLPSAAKNYPTYSSSQSRPTSTSPPGGRPILQRTNSVRHQIRTKSGLLGRSIFNA